MFGWIFGRKKEVEKLREDVKGSFKHVREDIENISKWIKHLNENDSKKDFEIEAIKERLSSIESEIEGLKNSFEMLNIGVFQQVFKTPKQVFKKQTGVEAVQTPVQTPVQTGENVDLSQYSVMERALIFVLLNSDMKLSYDDLAAITGKSRTTIRGQINSIKQKSESLISEIIEKNGKKRVFIPDEIKEKLLKNVKVRVQKKKKEKE